MEEFLINGQTSDWLGEELTNKLWNFARINNRLLKNIDVAPALVHSDCNGLNILVSESKEHYEVTGIIDWEFACAGPVYVDIGNMLRYENIPYFAGLKIHLSKVYSRVELFCNMIGKRSRSLLT